jgi:hypothetical protein
MKIATHGLFHTPASMDEIIAWIERFPADTRPALLTAAMMTWNYLATQVNEKEPTT